MPTDLQMDARAVAGLAVGIDRAPVPDRLQGLNAGLDHLTPRRAVDGRDETDAAILVLVRRVVGVGGLKPLHIRLPVGHEGVAAGHRKLVILFHVGHPRLQEARSSAALAFCSI